MNLLFAAFNPIYRKAILLVYTVGGLQRPLMNCLHLSSSHGQHKTLTRQRTMTQKIRQKSWMNC